MLAEVEPRATVVPLRSWLILDALMQRWKGVCPGVLYCLGDQEFAAASSSSELWVVLCNSFKPAPVNITSMVSTFYFGDKDPTRHNLPNVYHH